MAHRPTAPFHFKPHSSSGNRDSCGRCWHVHGARGSAARSQPRAQALLLRGRTAARLILGREWWDRECRAEGHVLPKTANGHKSNRLFPQEGSAGPDCARLGVPGGSWKGTGIPSCTDDPSGRSILVLRESRTFSSMLFRKLVLLFSKITETVT